MIGIVVVVVVVPVTVVVVVGSVFGGVVVVDPAAVVEVEEVDVFESALRFKGSVDTVFLALIRTSGGLTVP